MPFRKGFKITLTNEMDKALRLCFYDVDFTLGDKVTPKTGYFHAHFRREIQTIPGKDFEILPYLKGEGRYLGCNLGVLVNSGIYGTLWWGEGEVKVYLDGDKDYPTLCGTGTEDYIATGWGQGEYANQWHGCPFADKGRAYGFYRLHGPDPVFFHKDIRVTIQQIGIALKQQAAEVLKAGKLSEMIVAQTGQKLTAANIDSQDLGRNFLFDRSDDWSATTYFYLNQPEDSLPGIVPYSARIAGLPTPIGGHAMLKSNLVNPADPK